MKSSTTAILFVILCLNVMAKGDDLLKVYYHVWVDSAVTEKYKITLKVPEGSTFYDVMVLAAAEDDDFEFEDVDTEFGKFITAIGGRRQDLENEIYWWLYIDNKAPSKNSPPGVNEISPLGASNLVVQDGEHYLFWLHSPNFNHQ